MTDTKILDKYDCFHIYNFFPSKSIEIITKIRIISRIIFFALVIFLIFLPSSFVFFSSK